jgi:hypothetical protein
MSTPVRRQPDDRIELESVTNWGALAAAGGWGLLILGVPIALALFVGARAAFERSKANTGAAPGQEVAAWRPPPIEPLSDTTPRTGIVAETRKAAPVVEGKKAPPTRPARKPAAVEKAEEDQAADAPSSRRVRGYTDQHLLAKLNDEAREIDLEAEKGASAKLLEEAKKAAKPEATVTKGSADKDTPHPLSKTQPVLAMIARRADLKGLPMRDGPECQIGAKEARSLQELSQKVRGATSQTRNLSRSTHDSFSEVDRRNQGLINYLSHEVRVAAKDTTTVRTLVQMFQAEDVPVRLQLVKALADVKGEQASVALAQRAVFDLAAEVREAAIKALRARTTKEYRQVLLDGLRYPWAPVADQAAKALIELGDKGAILDLVLLLARPDPRAPVEVEKDKWVAPEMVRMNHLRNCLLCHAPSLDRDDPIRGLVPEPGKPLAEVYYESQRGTFVRADVTYLKQDFSVTQVVSGAHPWPHLQRFDYLIRKRELSADEVKRLGPPGVDRAGKPASYPQRDAVLWALCELTGLDVGDRSEDWYQLLWEQWLG